MQTALLPPGIEHGLTPLLALHVSEGYWLHLPLLIVLISLVYSATRFDDWKHIMREGLRWGLRLALFLVVIMVILYGLVSFM
jgi:hypothetical protein